MMKRYVLHCVLLKLKTVTLLHVDSWYVLTISDREVSFKFQTYVPELYECTLKRLKAADIDQEVKERAISCM